MRVIAHDHGVPPQSGTAEVELSVIRNTHAPVFIQDFYSASVNEMASSGTSLLKVSATDDDQALQPDVCVYNYLLPNEKSFLNIFVLI